LVILLIDSHSEGNFYSWLPFQTSYASTNLRLKTKKVELKSLHSSVQRRLHHKCFRGAPQVNGGVVVLERKPKHKNRVRLHFLNINEVTFLEFNSQNKFAIFAVQHFNSTKICF